MDHADDWAYDEAYELHQIKGKLAPVLDYLLTVRLPQHIEETVADLAGMVAEDAPAVRTAGPEVNYVF